MLITIQKLNCFSIALKTGLRHINIDPLTDIIQFMFACHRAITDRDALRFHGLPAFSGESSPLTPGLHTYYSAMFIVDIHFSYYYILVTSGGQADKG